MSLLQTIDSDYITAYKGGDEVKVAVLRMLKTAIKNVSVDLGREPDDDIVLDLVGKQVKQRKESIEQFTRAGRTELAAREELEIRALEGYLPSQLDDEELAQAIADIVAETGAATMKDMGTVMGALTARYKGRYDGRKASELVRAKLTS